MRGFDELISMMLNETIDGFFVDRNTYRHVLHRISEPKYNYIYKRMIKMQGILFLIDFVFVFVFLLQRSYETVDVRIVNSKI